MRNLVLISAAAFASTAAAQWLNYPAPSIPRLPDGKPNLSAPTPRTPDGKPDLSGIWEHETTRQGPFDTPPGIEIKPEDVVLTPEGEAQQRRRKENYFPGAQCVPENIVGLPSRGLHLFKVFSNTGVVAILYELQTTYRQIFTDGRPLPTDPNPAWRGYSVGRWDGDTLVVDTSGFNDQAPVPRGVHSEAFRIIERFRRPDFGHLEIQYTIDDPKVYAKPWTIKQHHHLTPDTELMEYFCNENERDLKHMVGVDR